MKKPELDKLQGLKLSGAMKQAVTPGRFSSNAALAPNRREQRKLDQAQGLVPFAVKLDFDLVKQPTPWRRHVIPDSTTWWPNC